MNYWYDKKIRCRYYLTPLKYSQITLLSSLIEKNSDQLSFLIFKNTSFRYKILNRSKKSVHFKWFFNFLNNFTEPSRQVTYQQNVPLDVLRFIASIYPENIMEELTKNESRLSYNTLLIDEDVLSELHDYYCYNYDRLHNSDFKVQLSNQESNALQNGRIKSLVSEIYNEQKMLK